MGLLQRASNGERWLFDLSVAAWLGPRGRPFCPPALLGKRVGDLTQGDLLVVRDAFAAAERALKREMSL
jgi:hypothetical protein